MTPEEARDELVRLLELEPMGGRPDGRATWEDIVTYVAKRGGTMRLALATVRRRTLMLADAVGLDADASWLDGLRRARLYRERVTEGGPPPAVDTAWANEDAGPPPSAGADAPDALKARMRCATCGHMFNRHDPDGDGCVVRVEVNHVDGVATGFEPCGCRERRPE